MANEKYLDYTGLQELVTKVLSAITTNGNLKVSKSTTGTSGTGTVDNDGVKIKLQLTNSTYKTAFIKLDNDKITLDVQNSDITDEHYGRKTLTVTPEGIYIENNGSNPISLFDKLNFADNPTQDSDEAITAGGVYTALLNVIGIAEGKTKNYVIHSSSGTNQDFNTTSEQAIVNEGTYIFDVNNTPIAVTNLKIGDIVSIVETTLPDRWLGNVTGDAPNRHYVFYPLETKLNIDANPTENSTNPVSSGGVYSALQDKQDSMTAITTAEVDALF